MELDCGIVGLFPPAFWARVERKHPVAKWAIETIFVYFKSWSVYRDV